MMNNRTWPKLVAAIVVACAVVSVLDYRQVSSKYYDRDYEATSAPADEIQLHRSLQLQQPEGSGGKTDEYDEEEEEYAATGDETEEVIVGDNNAVYPWARTNLHPLAVAPDPSNDRVLFWHIPKSGGSTAKALFRCYHKTTGIATRYTDLMMHKQGMESGELDQVDMFFSTHPAMAITHLFDSSENRGRAMALFRHPVDRLVSMFYYLQVATWEKSYRPDWENMDIFVWAKTVNGDNNFMVKNLAGKIARDTATEDDLHAAMDTLKETFVVGLMDEMRESVRRFNIVVGIDESEGRIHQCLGRFFGRRERKQNSNSHPKVEEGSPTWQLLAEKNALDIRLYEYVLELFEEQKELVDSYAASSGSIASSLVSRLD